MAYRLAAVAAAALFAAVTVLAAAPASAVPAPGHGAGRRCTPVYSWNWHRSSHPEYVQAVITGQCVPNWSIETRAICSTRGGGTYTRYSGIVTNEGTQARATCNLLPSSDNLQYCAVRVKNPASGWQAWRTVCTPVTARRR